MRMDLKVAALSLAVLAGACSRREEPTTATLSDDLKRDLAAASAPGDLAGAPQKFERMRFVSDVERVQSNTPAKSPRVARSTVRSTVKKRPAPAPAAARSPEPVATPVSEPMPEPMVIAQRPSPDPVNVPVGTNDGGMGERGRNGGVGGSRGVGGLGGILGGIIGAVVIRGGHGGVDKCDPRTDGRNRGGPVIDRPDYGSPYPTGGTFPRSRRIGL